MRNAQISIELSMTNNQAWNGHQEKIRVYADSNNAFEAVCAGFWELLTALQEQGHEMPGFGRREHICAPSAAGMSEEERMTVRQQLAEERRLE